MIEIKNFYDKKIPVHIKKYSNIEFSWDEINDIIKFHEDNHLGMIKNDSNNIILHFGFYSKKINDIAEKIDLVGLEKNKIYSSHLYVDYEGIQSPLGWHNDNCEVIYLQALGSVKWEIENYGEYILSEGDIIYCPKKMKHNVISINSRVGISFGIK